jgi:hypothetical protein
MWEKAAVSIAVLVAAAVMAWRTGEADNPTVLALAGLFVVWAR